jgi:hypothetical protein
VSLVSVDPSSPSIYPVLVNPGEQDRGKSARDHQSLLPAADDFAISFLMFIVIMIYYRIHPGWPMLLFPCFLPLAVVTALGVGLWLSGAGSMA